MISEATFAKKFTSFWNEILPNSKNYVRLINGGLIEALYEPFEAAERKNNIALINVLSFNMLRSFCNNESTFEELNKSSYTESEKFQEIIGKSLQYLSKFKYGNNCSLPLSNNEKAQINRLFKAMYDQCIYDSCYRIIDPHFDGCGFINKSYGDLVSDNKIIEIKSGERRFSVTDVRQIIIYLVLNHYSSKPINIASVMLFNPRMGIIFAESVENFCMNLSGLSSQELFIEIQKFIVDNNFIETYGF